MKLKKSTTYAALILAALASANAADRFKANNTTTLNLAASWDVLPDALGNDVAVWNNTLTAANSSAYGANLNWQGIRIANPTGLVTIGASSASLLLTLGSAGIDLSAATQNLTINGSVVAGTNQVWSVDGARTLQLHTVNTNSELTGSGNLTLSKGPTAGTATFLFNPGQSGSLAFTDQGGFYDYTGNWTINSGVLVRTLRNGRNAWGSGTITLNGGTLAQHQNYSGTWTNNIILQTGSTSTIDDRNNSGTRSLKLQGVISGDGNLAFSETNAAVSMTADTCYVLTAANTMSGVVSLGDINSFVRVGGDGGNDVSMGAGTTGSLGTAAVTNNGTLSFTRNNAHLVANAISGTGSVRVGSANLSDTAIATGSTATATQELTLSGTNTYTGATTVVNGRLILTGTLASAVTVSSGATLGGSGSTTGTITLGTGSSIVGGTGTAFVSGNGVSNGSTAGGVSIIDATAGAIGPHLINVVGYGTGSAPVLANFNTANFRGGVLTDDTANKKITFSYTNEIKTWNTTTGTWDNHLTANWSGGSDGLYYQNDAVVFGGIAADSTVTLVGTISPLALEVSNPANTYTFAGSPISGTTGLTKSGDGTLLLTVPNTFTGNVTIQGGTLKAGASQVLGTQQPNKPVTQVVIHSGGALDFNGLAEIYGYTIAGTGVGGTGALTNGSATAIGSGLAQATNLKLAADASIGGTGNWFLLNNGYAATSLDLNGFTLTKSGANAIGLINTTTTAGTVRVAEGTLALGDLASTTLVNGSASAFALDDNVGATLAVARNATIGSLAGGGTTGGQVVLSANLTVGALNTPTTFGGSITGGGSLTKTGTSILTLTNTSSYSGTTTVSAGTLRMDSGGHLDAASTVTVAAGATLAVAGTGTIDTSLLNLAGGALLDGSAATTPLTLAAGQIWTAGHTSGTAPDIKGDFATSDGLLNIGGTALNAVLSFDNALSLAGGTLGFDVGNMPAAAADKVTVAGALSLTGTTTIQINPTGGPLAPGVYQLMSYGSLAAGSGANLALTGITASSTTRQSITLESQPGELDLVVAGSVAHVKWNGGTAGNWDAAATTNWLVTDASFSGAGNTFYQGDYVSFLDDPGAPTTIHLMEDVSVSGLTFNNTTTDYTLDGTAILSGSATLVKKGTAATTLSLAGPSTFSGGIRIEAGLLKIDTPDFVPAGAALTVDGGTLNAAADLTFGAVHLAAGTLASATGLEWITATGYLMDSGSVGAILTGSGAALIKATAGTVTLTADNTYTGATTINEGILQLGTGGAAGKPGTGAITIGSGASLVINRNDIMPLTQTVTGGGVLRTEGSGTTLVTNTCSHSGGTEIAIGSHLQVGNGGAAGSLGAATISNNGTLSWKRSDAQTVAANIIGSGVFEQLGTGSIQLAGTLATSQLRFGGSSYTTEIGTANWTALLNAAVSGAPVLDLGTSGDKGDLVLSDAFNGGTLTLGGISGAGKFRSDWGGTGARTVRLEQAGDTLFSGGFLSHNNGISARTLSVIKAGPGKLTLTGTSGSQQTSSVGTADLNFKVEAGTLQLGDGTTNPTLAGSGLFEVGAAGALVIDSSGTDAATALTLGRNLTGSGPLTLTSDGTAGEGWTKLTGSLGGFTGTLNVTSGTELLLDTTATYSLAAGISGTGNLQKTGIGSVTLTGTNTYTGVTTVSGGTLAVTGTSIVDGNKLVIDGGKVEPTGTETVGTLFFGTEQMAAGTWGATGSGASHIDDTRFAGTGKVLVVTGATSGYDQWKIVNANGQAPNLDYDQDGVTNGVEYFMGETGSSFTANPGVVNGKVTWKRDPAAVATFVVQVADDLTNWSNLVPPHASIDESVAGQVTFTLPTGARIKFCRLVVTP